MKDRTATLQSMERLFNELSYVECAFEKAAKEASEQCGYALLFNDATEAAITAFRERVLEHGNHLLREMCNGNE